MKLQLFRNGDPVDLPPFRVGAHFYYAEGKIGIHAEDGWSIEQSIFAEPEPAPEPEPGPEIDPDAEPAPPPPPAPEPEPVVIQTILWSVAAMEVEEEVPTAPPPQLLRARMPKLSPVQFRKMLRGQAISAAMVEAAIALIPDDEDRAHALDAWEYSTYFERINPLIDLIGAALDLTPEEIDAAWTSALT